MALYDEFERQPNRLINAQSTYLQHAAYQPVGWFEYGPEAFAEAKRQHKPVLLDIGASWCHWCHVIDRESYEHPQIATLINEHFIPIKVDRDERPDIDARYQAALHQLVGMGGWPLTMFLTEEGVPFYGGTYFPPEDIDGHPGMASLLPRLAQLYHAHPQEIAKTARLVQEQMAQEVARVAEPGKVSDTTYQTLLRGIQDRFNQQFGGFELSGPKFPHPGALELAPREWYDHGDEAWLKIVGRTLFAMGEGGIYDQLGGGFHRYAVDATWTVPHFEKMSFDNALLLELYAHAWAATGIDFYHKIALGTLTFILRDLTDHQRGGFYAAQDADVGLNDDGAYWTWSLDEFFRVLPREESSVLARYYGVRLRGDMPEDGRNVLRVTESAERIAADLQIPLEAVERQIEENTIRLYEVRKRRKAPMVDKNKFANWNALLISACLQAGTLLPDATATQTGLRALDVLLADGYDEEQGVYHNFHSELGARLPGLLEDQVYTIRALVDAYTVRGEKRDLETACHLMELVMTRYWDEAGGGFVDRAQSGAIEVETPFVGHPRKGIDDLPTPSPNAVAALVLLQLGQLTGNERYQTAALQTLEAFATRAPAYGPFAATYGLALRDYLRPAPKVTVIGRLDDLRTRALIDVAVATYRPGRLVARYALHEPNLPYPPSEAGGALAYVCADHSCADPTSDPDHLRRIVQSYGRTRQKEAEGE